jgi:hypothetical protein
VHQVALARYPTDCGVWQHQALGVKEATAICISVSSSPNTRAAAPRPDQHAMNGSLAILRAVAVICRTCDSPGVWCGSPRGSCVGGHDRKLEIQGVPNTRPKDCHTLLTPASTPWLSLPPTHVHVPTYTN